ncbi:MAG: NUDIX domain-containing protein [Candidatus Buchananbacteria bacterium]|nr:NUDIX domain-containing protein [Candidatus Buchananbacteria bacterium]
MIREKSVGIILFRYNNRDKEVQYLVLYHRGTYWQFPKGRVEAGESEIETAKRELMEETAISNVSIIKGWRQQTQFFFQEERVGKKELIKKDYILYLAKMPKGAEVKISNMHNGYAWFNYKVAGKYLKFKSLKEIIKEADSYVEKQIAEYRKNKHQFSKKK